MSFTDYVKEVPTIKQKKTKRTEVGLDVLNEHFFDKFVSKVENDNNIGDYFEQLRSRIETAAESGQIKELDIENGVYQFKILDKDFELDTKDGYKLTISTPKMIKTIRDGEGSKKERYSITVSLKDDIGRDVSSVLDNYEG